MLSIEGEWRYIFIILWQNVTIKSCTWKSFIKHFPYYTFKKDYIQIYWFSVDMSPVNLIFTHFFTLNFISIYVEYASNATLCFRHSNAHTPNTCTLMCAVSCARIIKPFINIGARIDARTLNQFHARGCPVLLWFFKTQVFFKVRNFRSNIYCLL